MVASWLVRSTPDQVVRVLALAGVIVLCSWARHFTLTVLLFTQVYKWVPANMLGVTLRWTSIPSRGSSNTPSRFMPRKPELSTGPMGHLGLYKGFTFFKLYILCDEAYLLCLCEKLQDNHIFFCLQYQGH